MSKQRLSPVCLNAPDQQVSLDCLFVFKYKKKRTVLLFETVQKTMLRSSFKTTAVIHTRRNLELAVKISLAYFRHSSRLTLNFTRFFPHLETRSEEWLVRSQAVRDDSMTDYGPRPKWKTIRQVHGDITCSLQPPRTSIAAACVAVLYPIIFFVSGLLWLV